MDQPRVPIASRTRAAFQRKANYNHRSATTSGSKRPAESSRHGGFLKKSRAADDQRKKVHHRHRHHHRPRLPSVKLDDDDPIDPPSGEKKTNAPAREDVNWRGKEKEEDFQQRRGKEKVEEEDAEDLEGDTRKEILIEDTDDHEEEKDDEGAEEDDDVLLVTGALATTSDVGNGMDLETAIVVSSSEVEYEETDLSSNFGLTSTSSSLCSDADKSDPEFRIDETEDEEVEKVYLSAVDELDSSDDDGERRSNSRAKKMRSLSLPWRKEKSVSRKREVYEVRRKKQSGRRQGRGRRERDEEVDSSSASSGSRRRRRKRGKKSANFVRKVQKKYGRRRIDDLSSSSFSSSSDDGSSDDECQEIRKELLSLAGDDGGTKVSSEEQHQLSYGSGKSGKRALVSSSSLGKADRRKTTSAAEDDTQKTVTLSLESQPDERSVSSSSLRKRKRVEAEGFVKTFQPSSSEPTRRLCHQEQQQQPHTRSSVSCSFPPRKENKTNTHSSRSISVREVVEERQQSHGTSVSSKVVPTARPKRSLERPVSSDASSVKKAKRKLIESSEEEEEWKRPVKRKLIESSEEEEEWKRPVRKAAKSKNYQGKKRNKEEYRNPAAQSKNHDAGKQRRKEEFKKPKEVAQQQHKSSGTRKEKERGDEKTRKAAKKTTDHSPGRTTSPEPKKKKFKPKLFGSDNQLITNHHKTARLNSSQDQQSGNGVDPHKDHHEGGGNKEVIDLVDDDSEEEQGNDDQGLSEGPDCKETVPPADDQGPTDDDEDDCVPAAEMDNDQEEEEEGDSLDDNCQVIEEEEQNSGNKEETEADKEKKDKDREEAERFKNLVKKKPSEADIREILARFMTLDNENGLLEELYEDERRLNESRLREDQVVPEPMDELEVLWMEMERCLVAEAMGSCDSNVTDEDASSSLDCVTQRQLCRNGKHELVLEEQIGLVCRFCHFIETEIQNVTAEFHTDPFGVSASRRYRIRYPPTGHHPSSPNNNNDNPTAGDDDLVSDPFLNTDEAEVYIPTGLVWDLIPGLKKGMYPHQLEGFEFMWKNIGGRDTIQLSKLPKKHRKLECGGCIMSHAPGTGKTRLAISFVQSYLKFYKDSRPVIIAPCGMLFTWAKEFKTWNVDAPFHNLNDLMLSGTEYKPCLSLLGKCKNRNPATKNTVRLVKLQSWLKGGSVLGISYKLFEQLVGDISDEARKKKTTSANLEEEKMREALIKYSGLLVLDEGHTPRNESSKIFQALCKVESNKRIILSGTPFQNNLGELYNTLCLVRPQFADSIPEKDRDIFTQRRGGRRDRDKGQNDYNYLVGHDKNNHDKKKEKLKYLRQLIRPIVHIHKGSILREKLTGLTHNVVQLKPSEWQRELFDKAVRFGNNMEGDYFLSLLSVHPSLICGDEKPEAAAAADKQNESTRTKFFKGLPEGERNRLKDYKSKPLEGLKARFVIELVRLCIEERVLVFSQFIEPLELLNEALSSVFQWREGHEIHYINGKMSNRKRQIAMDLFNDPDSVARVMLASTRACSEGIKLVGASRVVLLDVVWNPSVERQAVSRAYRIGQKRRVYVYHLIASGTNEEDKYCRQMQKDKVSKLVFWSGKEEEEEPKWKLAGDGTNVMNDSVLDFMLRNDKLKSIFEKIQYQEI